MKQNLIGESPLFLSVLDKVSKLAAINRPVLIIGERGTGKELIAQRLHYLSRRWDQPLVTLNCSTLSEGLIDSELFGHESGAFTGSKGRHKGRFERAEQGSLFLDELATAPLSVQEKLLRVIEYGQYERVGGSNTIQADVRLICATNVDLVELAEQGQFRADLLDRLAFDVIHLPPLRHRLEDILLLAEHYAIKMCRELNLPLFPGFSTDAQNVLLQHPWPGNVRELKNVVERAIYQHENSEESIDDIILDPFITPWDATSENACSKSSNDDNKPNFQYESMTFPLDYKQWQEEQDVILLNQVMHEAKFNQRKAAELMSLSYHQFRGMIRKYRIKTA